MRRRLKWREIVGFPFVERGGRVGYCPNAGIRLPSYVLLRAANSSDRPLAFVTHARPDSDPDISINADDLVRLMPDHDGVSSVELAIARGRPFDLYVYAPSFWLPATVAALGWLATITGALLAYRKFWSDESTAQASSGALIVSLVVLTFGFVALHATVKLFVEVSQVRR
jgi:hypothetical protein